MGKRAYERIAHRTLHVTLGVIISIGLVLVVSLSPGPAQARIDPTPTPTTVPFLQLPFARDYQITSYFDHRSPDYTWDDTIVIFNGEQASAIDGILSRTATFKGGYYLPDTRWFVYYDGHNAYDYGTRAGVTVLAAAPGSVVFAGSAPSGCATPLQFVRIRHDVDHGGEPYYTSYLHLEGICVHEGDWVETGDPLGISGNSGCSLGPHLHFAVRRGGYYTDPRGWRPTDEPDPLIDYSGEQATWLWAEQEPLKAIGHLVQPTPGTRTNGDLDLRFVPDDDSPPISAIVFLAFYQDEWHELGTDGDGSDGWSLTWHTRQVPEGKVWVHAWAVGEDGRIGKGSPIVTGVTVDRHPPLGYIVGLQPDSVAGRKLWLYAASYDPESTTDQVSFLIREQGTTEWREIGDAEWLHTSNWLLEWEPDGIDDSRSIDVGARLTDGAGNTTLTQIVNNVTIDRTTISNGTLDPQSNAILTGPLDLVFSPVPPEAGVKRVDFYAWYGGTWHLAGVDENGSDGWRTRWNPGNIEDWSRGRIQARVTDSLGRVNSSLDQATNLVLDRTPPNAGNIHPASGGVARPGVPLSAWATDDGSGVDVVEFYANQGEGWIKIGEDRDAAEGWTLEWDGEGLADGMTDFTVRVVDRAGNETWADDAQNVALDRMPPSGQVAFPRSGSHLGGEITVSLDVQDETSDLDRAIFYAWYDGHWHHLGYDDDPQDGFEWVWDTTLIGAKGDVALTAWVYDRAGNVTELPHVEELTLSGYVPPTPTETVTPMLLATDTPELTDTPRPSNTPPAVPSNTPPPTMTPSLTSAPTRMPTQTNPVRQTDTPIAIPTHTAAPPATASPPAPS
ncbi:MAG: peptidoglycan DD-metalloendopeptidase family protein, partial [Anaerolineae bacterium]|nr:peptidoglycan DD-metalloendopeptidase family protein [Anaerolineae bacterium]